MQSGRSRDDIAGEAGKDSRSNPIATVKIDTFYCPKIGFFGPFFIDDLTHFCPENSPIFYQKNRQSCLTKQYHILTKWYYLVKLIVLFVLDETILLFDKTVSLCQMLPYQTILLFDKTVSLCKEFLDKTVSLCQICFTKRYGSIIVFDNFAHKKLANNIVVPLYYFEPFTILILDFLRPAGSCVLVTEFITKMVTEKKFFTKKEKSGTPRAAARHQCTRNLVLLILRFFATSLYFVKLLAQKLGCGFCGTTKSWGLFFAKILQPQWFFKTKKPTPPPPPNFLGKMEA